MTVGRHEAAVWFHGSRAAHSEYGQGVDRKCGTSHEKPTGKHCAKTTAQDGETSVEPPTNELQTITSMTGNGHIELFKVTSYNFQPSRAR